MSKLIKLIILLIILVNFYLYAYLQKYGLCEALEKKCLC